MQYANVIAVSSPGNKQIMTHHAAVKVKYESVFGKAPSSTNMSTEMYMKAGLTMLALVYFLHKYGVFDYIKNQVTGG